MSEKLKPNIDLKEILNPRNTPEIGFQSYELLEGDGEYRNSQRELFISGEIVQPEFDYPELNDQDLDKGIANLHKILTLADSLEEPIRGAIWDTAAYRMAEMYWLKSLIKINTAYNDGNSENVQDLIKESQKLNEELYGTPSELDESEILGELFSQISEKDLSQNNQVILNELLNGFSVNVAGETVEVSGLEYDPTVRSPEISTLYVERLKEKLYQEFTGVLEIVDQYHTEVILKKSEDEQIYTPADLYEVFSRALRLRDPEGKSGVRIILDPDATALSWSTPDFAVIVGAKRLDIKKTKKLKPVDIVKSLVVHELGIHGGKAINGVDTPLPILGSGVYSDSDPGERSDYLTFEEGLASNSQKIIEGSGEEWEIGDFEKTLALSLAYKGYSFRQVFETLWRFRALIISKTGEDISESSLAMQKRNAYMACRRIFRGTPTSMNRIDENGQPIIHTYNKDLSYYTGKKEVMKFVETASEEVFSLGFRYKIDPTNHFQLELAKLVTSG